MIKNTHIESFFASLKAELVDHCRFVSVTQAQAEIFHYIEAFYNRQRLHSTLGYRSPNLFEADSFTGI